MRLMVCLGSFVLLAHVVAAETADRKSEYVNAITRGAGFLPWQEKDISAAEVEFRMAMEARKNATLRERDPLPHPVLLTSAELARARSKVGEADWAKAWLDGHKALADFIVAQPDGYVAAMIPELTPWFGYGFTCPNCVERLSQEGAGSSLYSWSRDDPDVIRCKLCGQVYPDPHFPETARLECPRARQSFTFYLNDAERDHPDDRSGKHAWHWVGRPMHMSFTGVVRQEKVTFMIGALKSLAYAYVMTDEPVYAEKAAAILLRLGVCYPNWLYHDYWGSVADCDPMYAAWHDMDLPLEWKRHLCAEAFNNDTADRARMLQTYWGGGRYHPSTDSVSSLPGICLAYDLVYDARDRDGNPLWTPERRWLVEGDLIIEWIIGAEPYIGGRGKANRHDNKTPRIYYAQAAVARCLGLPEIADTALRGYEAVRDQSFAYDGFSHESPAYNNMYLGALLGVPETLHGFRWPDGFAARNGVVDLYANDARLRLMYRAVVDQVQPNGRYLPIEDTNVAARPSRQIVEKGLYRYPEYYAGVLPIICPGYTPAEYALFRFEADTIEDDASTGLPEVFFPAWKTAFLRNGAGPEASVLALSASSYGGHRHHDNLGMLYVDRGQTILGDLGYVGDMPVNTWIRSTFSHNLVIVDDQEQAFKERHPSFGMMATTPGVSVASATSNAYPQCTNYRRLVALVKGPNGQTFAVDIFRVAGGAKHDYRVFSELASSDAQDGSLNFVGIDMPGLPPLPEVGTSLRREDIFGLRDTSHTEGAPAWQATWRQEGREYRLWMLSQVDRVEASNGPGQRTRNDCGRRVRYVDAVREGDGLSTTFVAIHEPSGPDGAMPLHIAKRLPVPESAGPDAVAIHIESDWGTYTVLSEFAGEAEVAGVRFEGTFGIVCTTPAEGTWTMALGARTLQQDGLGFVEKTARWAGQIVENTESAITTDTPQPADWPDQTAGCRSYVAADRTGFPVAASKGNTITVERFPLPDSAEFKLPALRFLVR